MNMEVDDQYLQEFDEFMFYNKLGMVLLGIWPLDKKASSLKTFGWKLQLATIYSIVFSLIIAQWIDMYELWGNVDATSETFLTNAYVFAVTIKLASFLKYMETFRDIQQNMRENYVRVMSDAEPHNKELLYDQAMKAKIRSIRYYLVIISNGSLYALMSILRENPFRDRKYPFFGIYYIDRNSDIIYYIFYCVQLLTGCICALASFATDSTFLVCTYHLCAQLQILQNDLMDLGRKHVQDTSDQIKHLVRRHQAEIRNADALQKMFSQSGFQQILLSCLMIAATGFKLIISMNNRDIDFFRYILCVPCTLLQILCYCQPGDDLMVQSEALAEAIYQSSWINLDNSTIKSLIFMIQRSQKPLCVLAGKIYLLSLENFMKILKTALSGLSVLQAVYQGDA